MDKGLRLTGDGHVLAAGKCSSKWLELGEPLGAEVWEASSLPARSGKNGAGTRQDGTLFPGGDRIKNEPRKPLFRERGMPAERAAINVCRQRRTCLSVHCCSRLHPPIQSPRPASSRKPSLANVATTTAPPPSPFPLSVIAFPFWDKHL